MKFNKGKYINKKSYSKNKEDEKERGGLSR